MTERRAWLHYWLPGFLAGFGLGLIAMLAALGYLR